VSCHSLDPRKPLNVRGDYIFFGPFRDAIKGVVRASQGTELLQEVCRTVSIRAGHRGITPETPAPAAMRVLRVLQRSAFSRMRSIDRHDPTITSTRHGVHRADNLGVKRVVVRVFDIRKP